MTPPLPLAVIDDDTSVRLALVELLAAHGFVAIGYEGANPFLWAAQRQLWCAHHRSRNAGHVWHRTSAPFVAARGFAY